MSRMKKINIALLEIALNAIILIIMYQISDSYFCGGVTSAVCIVIDQYISSKLMPEEN